MNLTQSNIFRFLSLFIAFAFVMVTTWRIQWKLLKMAFWPVGLSFQKHNNKGFSSVALGCEMQKLSKKGLWLGYEIQQTSLALDLNTFAW